MCRRKLQICRCSSYFRYEQSPVGTSPATAPDHLLRRNATRPRSRRRDPQNNFQQRSRRSFASLLIILKPPRLSTSSVKRLLVALSCTDQGHPVVSRHYPFGK